MAEPPGVAPELWGRLAEQAEAEFGVALDEAQLRQLAVYLELLCEWNQKFNLTAIEDPAEILVKHFLDSLSCALSVDLKSARSLIDVGTGAGFPGLVLKIAFPHLQVTLLDALDKRLRFLERVSTELGLKGVTTVHARAEDAARPAAGTLREKFDVVTARAVARLRVLAEWTLPFARVGGCLLAMKGPEIAEEAAEAGPALKKLGGGEATFRELVLPGTDLGRSLVRVEKLRPTPREFPRRPGTARKHPL